MKVVFKSYTLDDDIPVKDYLQNRKLAKYFNRETRAAVVCVGMLSQQCPIPVETSFYYARGLVEYEEYGLKQIVEGSIDESGKFSPEGFIKKGMAGMSPLTQFKILFNMPLSFVSIAYNLTGDNAVIYSSGPGLIMQARHAPPGQPVLLGAGRVYSDGRVESGFALAEAEEIETAPLPDSPEEAIEIFRLWSRSERTLK